MIAKKTRGTLLLVLTGFAVYMILFEYFKDLMNGLDHWISNRLLSYTIVYIAIGIPLFIVTRLLNPGKNILRTLGLKGLNGIQLGAPILFSIPMLAGGMFFFPFNHSINVNQLVAGTILAGLFEELYFRGYFFGLIFNNTSLGFVPSILLGALIFATGHIHQGKDPGDILGIFMITFMGAVYFAWLYAEWAFNLWIPILLHFLMNLSWSLFNMDYTAQGNLTANLLRAATITLAIVFTLKYKKKMGIPLEVNRRTLLHKALINKGMPDE